MLSRDTRVLGRDLCELFTELLALVRHGRALLQGGPGGRGGGLAVLQRDLLVQRLVLRLGPGHGAGVLRVRHRVHHRQGRVRNVESGLVRNVFNLRVNLLNLPNGCPSQSIALGREVARL